MAGMCDLPTDALCHVAHFLTAAQDLASLAASCRLLRGVVAQDAVWRQQCEAWLAARRSASNGLAAMDAPQLLGALRLPSYRLLYQALHLLGAWPAGLWCCANEAALPRGCLLVAQLHPPSGSLQLRQPRPRVLAGPAAPRECWELQAGVSLRAEPDAAGAQVRWVASSVAGFHYSVQLSLNGQMLAVHRSSDRQDPPPAPGSRTIQSAADSSTSGAASLAVNSLAAYLGIAPARIQLESKQYHRVLPAPAIAQAAPSEPPGLVLLWQCQGVYSGSYGPHGLEVLSLTVIPTAGQDVPPLCPIQGPRLQALKLTGDPNVPARKFSFVADAASCRLGPYDPGRDDPFAPGGGVARPCLAFYEAATLVVALEQRPVRARFRAVGQINVVPGLWQPQWVPATLILYDAPLQRTLTIIFEDEGEPFRHAIDFTGFPFSSGGFISDVD